MPRIARLDEHLDSNTEGTRIPGYYYKGQVAIEFFLYAGVFLFVLIAVLSMVTLLQRSEIPSRETLVAREQGESIAEALRLSVTAGDGFHYNMTFPKKLLGRAYTLDFDDRKSVFVLTWNVSVGEVSYIYSLPAYRYRFEGCVSDLKLVSNECTNTLQLFNDGQQLVVRQE